MTDEDITIAKELARHADISTTTRYLHVQDTDLQEAHERAFDVDQGWGWLAGRRQMTQLNEITWHLLRELGGNGRCQKDTSPFL